MCLGEWKSDHTCPIYCERATKIDLIKKLNNDSFEIDAMLMAAIEQDVSIESIAQPDLKQRMIRSK